MTRDDIIRMALEHGKAVQEQNREVEYLFTFEGVAALLSAKREACAKRRGTLMFNPYTGTSRHPSDIASDPHGILLLDPEQPIRAIRVRGSL